MEESEKRRELGSCLPCPRRGNSLEESSSRHDCVRRLVRQHSVMTETVVDGETPQGKKPESTLKPGVVESHPCCVIVNGARKGHESCLVHPQQSLCAK